MSERLSPLHRIHGSAGADFTDFGGWTMPVAFDGIKDEHLAVRGSAGVFDVSHMSEVTVEGPDSEAVLDRLTTNDVTALDSGDAQYTCFLDESGVIIDDAVLYRYPDRDGYLFVPNAGHGAMMSERVVEHADDWGMSVTVVDRTDDVALLAVQGPDAVGAVEKAATGPVADIDRFTCRRRTLAGVDCLVARTGYTGEDGVEIFVDPGDATALWETFEPIQPCGLGARDTLRLEAGLLLSGQDFDPETEPRTPVEAGLTFVVDTDGEFVGSEVVADQRADGTEERMVGIRADGRGIPRSGYGILVDGDRVGHVTSGTKSPTFNVPLALGYVEDRHADPGTDVLVEIRDRTVEATVVDHRFLESID